MSSETTTNESSACNDDITKNSDGWVRSTEGKEFSRLLYPNPVCFLCTTSSLYNFHPRTATAVNDESSPIKSNHRNVMVISWLTAIDNNGYFMMSVNSRRHSVNHLLLKHPQSKNHPLTISSIQGDIKEKDDDDDGAPSAAVTFTLCVPTVEMKDLVLQVGGVSGKDHCKFGSMNASSRRMNVSTKADANLSKRKRRKLQKQRLEAGEGISGLVALPYDGFHDHVQKKKKNEEEESDNHQHPLNAMADEPSNSDVKNDGEFNGIPGTNSDQPFVIQGTVAHMKCQIQSLLHNHCSGDDSKNPEGSIVSGIMVNDVSHEMGPKQQTHHVFLAKVVDAYCHRDYWDSDKLLFCPKENHLGTGASSSSLDDDMKKKVESETLEAGKLTTPSPPNHHLRTVPPFLTFLGSQTFGQVVPLASSPTT